MRLLTALAALCATLLFGLPTAATQPSADTSRYILTDDTLVCTTPTHIRAQMNVLESGGDHHLPSCSWFEPPYEPVESANGITWYGYEVDFVPLAPIVVGRYTCYAGRITSELVDGFVCDGTAKASENVP